MRKRFSGWLLVCLLVCLLLFSAAPAFALGKLQGYVGQGGADVVTKLTGSTIKAQRTYPNAQVTVYLAGTTTIATIYADSSLTAKANPFTADSTAFWFFYAADGDYDVRFSGGGIATPWTVGGLHAGSGGSGSSLPFITITDAPYNARTTNADNLSNLNAVSAACRTAGGCTIIIPLGTFVSSLTWAIPSNTTVIGMGAGSIIKRKDGTTIGADSSLIRNDSPASNVVFSNFAVDGNQVNQPNGPGSPNQSQGGLRLVNCTNCTIRGTWSHANINNGIYVESSTRCSILDNYVYDQFDSVLANADGDGIVVTNSNNCTISRNHSYNNGNDGMVLGANLSSASGNILSNNTITANVANGIEVPNLGFACFNNQIVNNVVVGNGTNGLSNGISLFNATGTTTTAHDFIISGNTTASNGHDGIYIDRYKNVVVANNLVVSNTTAGVHLDGTSHAIDPTINVTFTGNHLSGNGTDLIDTATDTRYVTVRQQSKQSFLFHIEGVGAGGAKHRITSEGQLGGASTLVSRITGASSTLNVTPSVSNVVDFTAGAGIDAGNTNYIVLNTAAVTSSDVDAVCSVSYTNIGGVSCDPSVESINVNGVTRVRLILRIYTTAGAAPNLAALTAGQVLEFRVTASLP